MTDYTITAVGDQVSVQCDVCQKSHNQPIGNDPVQKFNTAMLIWLRNHRRADCV